MADKKESFVAQCWGGPEHGNLVEATVKEWEYIISTTMYTDGPGQPPTQSKTIGWYKLVPYVFAYNKGKETMVWNWIGPGADGETMERVRKI
jgi:hypothetical protein